MLVIPLVVTVVTALVTGAQGIGGVRLFAVWS
jgi:hypothetical protein